YEAISYRIIGLTNFQIINAYRILPYVFYISIPIFLLSITRNIKKNLEIWILIVLVIVTSVGIYLSNLNTNNIGNIDSNKILTSTLSSNYIPIYSRNDIWDNYRVPYMNLSDIKNLNFSIIGQFEESSYLNHFAISLSNAIDQSIKQSFVSKIVYIEDMKLNPSKLNLVKDLFNIGYSISSNENDKNICFSEKELQTINTRYLENGKFNMRNDSLKLCELKDGTSSDVNIYSDTGIFRNVISTNWNSEVINWWGSDKNEILVENGNIDQKGEQGKIDTEINFNWSKNFQSFNFDVPSSDNIWILVKEQYSPRWKAYNEKNEELKIYRVSPSMMLINSKGMITFKYEFNWWESILKISSLMLFTITISYLVICKIRIISKQNK
ncbi:MAG: hypothetical protein WCK31_03610, partial [bacterium]